MDVVDHRRALPSRNGIGEGRSIGGLQRDRVVVYCRGDFRGSCPVDKEGIRPSLLCVCREDLDGSIFHGPLRIVLARDHLRSQAKERVGFGVSRPLLCQPAAVLPAV